MSGLDRRGALEFMRLWLQDDNAKTTLGHATAVHALEHPGAVTEVCEVCGAAEGLVPEALLYGVASILAGTLEHLAETPGSAVNTSREWLAFFGYLLDEAEPPSADE